jgi:hypothetical protein
MSSNSPVTTAVGARALASRINGARSRGPRTAAGKARSARNALKHGLCARKLVVVPDEDAAEFAALQAALIAELAPVGALQAVLAQRIVSAAWRLMRADRIEAEVLVFRSGRDRDLGLALTRDGNGSKAVPTLLRYRGTALAELMRCLRTLQALQAEARAGDLAAPARRRRGRPIVPANGRKTDGLAATPAAAPPAPAPARRHPAAAAPRPAIVATAQDNRANPPARPFAQQPTRPETPDPDLAAIRPALASLLAVTERTRGSLLDQGVDARISG